MHIYINGAGFMLLSSYLILQIVISGSIIAKHYDDEITAFNLVVLLNLIGTILMFLIIFLASISSK